MDERWNILPKWAQEQYKAALREVESMKEDRLALTDPNSVVQVETGSIPNSRRIGFKRHSTVYFKMGPRDRDEIYMLVDQENNLRVYSHGRLKVIPQASNCVHLETSN